MTCRRRIIKSPKKAGTITEKQAREVVETIQNKYIKIGRIGKMEVRISINVQKVDNGFILHKDIYGIKMTTEMPDTSREVYVTFPEVRKRIVKLLKKIAFDLEERIPEKT